MRKLSADACAAINDGSRQQTGGDRWRGADADFAKAGALDRFDVVARVAQLGLDRLGAGE